MWLQAIKEEFRNMNKMGVWRVLNKPTGGKRITSTWVFKIKTGPNGEITRFKARLVARGFLQVKGKDFNFTYAPVSNIKTARILLALGAKNGWEIIQYDATAAFLNGVLDKKQEMCIPQGGWIGGLQQGQSLMLDKAIYGLKNSGRAWFLTLSKELTRLGFTQCVSDQCLWTFEKDNTVIHMLIYVDDFLVVTNNKDKLKDIMLNLNKKFIINCLGDASFYLGMRIIRNIQDKSITLDINAYIQVLLQKFKMQECNSVTTPMQPNQVLRKGKLEDKLPNVDHQTYRSLVGALLYAALTCRPDILQAVIACAKYVSAPISTHMTAAKRVLRYLKGNSTLMIGYAPTKQHQDLTAYSDSDYATDLDTRKSISGMIIYYYGGPVAWLTKQQQCVAQSSAEAELMAAVGCAKEILYLRKIFTHLGLSTTSPTQMFQDNQATIKMSTLGNIRRCKHIDIRYHFLTEKMVAKQLKITYKNTKEMTADFFTKPLPRPAFLKHRATFMLHRDDLQSKGGPAQPDLKENE